MYNVFKQKLKIKIITDLVCCGFFFYMDMGVGGNA